MTLTDSLATEVMQFNVTNYTMECSKVTSQEQPSSCEPKLYTNSSTSPPNTDNVTMTSLRFDDVSPSALMVFFLVLYSLICLFGTVGNGLVMYVVARYAKMRSVTNTYIVNLAIADCCFLVGLPMLMVTAVKQMWIFGHALCKVSQISRLI